MMRHAKAATRLAALLFLTGAASAAKLDDKQAELSGVRQRINALDKDLSKSEESRADATEQLRETELSISKSNRRLRELAETHNEITANLATLDTQIKALDGSTASEQRQLARLLNRQFVGGDSNALRLLLAGKDPNQAARDRYFLTRLSVAKATLTRELRAVAANKRQLRERVQAQEIKIRTVEDEQKVARSQLLKEQQQRQVLLSKLAGRIKAQRKEIGELRRDEQRLGTLLDQLARAASQRKPSAKVSPRDTAVRSKDKAPTIRNADPGRVGGAFAALRGRLPLPVSGALAGHFGTARSDGGGAWKGLFIKAGEGADVRAVAAGSVVFSDWLRGFGNLIILDHGDDFLSIYAYNQSLLKTVGSSIKPGEVIASVGNSGGHAESGLYFELRYQGQAFDPLKWIKR